MSTSPYELAQEFSLFTNRSVFITGNAGTGKTTFLRKLRELTEKRMAVVAPTGVAAINARGVTIHSFFQLPFTPFLPTSEGRLELIKKLKMQAHRRKLLQELELLVIDEISMVRADVLDAIDTVLRHFRSRHNEPFGGVQMLFIGDMYQLSPVAGTEEQQILSAYYKSIFFFNSEVILQHPPVYIEFDKIFRQNKLEFITLLNEIRNNQLSDNSRALLDSRYLPDFVPEKDDDYITLTTHNKKADAINLLKLDEIKNKPKRFYAKIQGVFPPNNYPVDEVLELKEGAKVMFVKNDTEQEKRFYNGKIGTVKTLGNSYVEVECADGERIELTAMSWENIRYSTNSETLQIEEETIGVFSQLPLRLAWAITIHKSQGLSFDKAIIDAGAAFASGQVYVALSRCRTIEGLVLLSKIKTSSLQVNRDIKIFANDTQKEKKELPLKLDNAKNEFLDGLILSLFDFRIIAQESLALLLNTRTKAESFSKETIPFLEELSEQAGAMCKVGEKFSMQLRQITSSDSKNIDFLNERLEAAENYFKEQLTLFIEKIKKTPATSDNKKNAKNYDEDLESIYSETALKQHLLKNGVAGLTVEKYFARRNSFVLIPLSARTYSSNLKESVVASEHPELLRELSDLRNKISKEENIPVFIVSATKSLIEMSNYLPLSLKDLHFIHGFGKKKIEKWGDDFLSIIKAYCSRKELCSQMNKIEKKKKKETGPSENKREKGNSMRISYDLYKAGKSPREIATERNITETTVAGHLAEYIKSGTLDIKQLLSEEKIKSAEQALENKKRDESAYKTLSPILTQKEFIYFMAWIRRGNEE